ncbi:helix-turn-helix domain-containing protein [Corynebacterium sp. 153RC1]|uniref:GAF domain-containing protein n=1 Tax=unclassified Corynebacterium TaxID=2624378 RepID=UPI00211CEB98|nr:MULTISPECIES: helix-turn-helix domain-containing protein [unclassified Corynebacterium]MCQ9353424.1 helix-turn-helix domain-containing protein [Corynebacterium sp. 209RC1]MCQ9355646.1 helix-turn-helix domain-containing protein [Corynebacterium sp. 1222RC1]MCQ9357839.1 helix-turn-helix domain-containing protein [Corynebacterium sp. 122RC1]MCQ9360023.1 helix-turn-helix domain-containing protein [Corynebacterium sp. 142RC1]MCQ9362167.1 helix-turn-helix domain-containing protein [Corynebacteriu
MSDDPFEAKFVSLCQDALRLPIDSFREQLFASPVVQDSASMREVLMAVNNQAESNRKYRNLIAEIADLSDRFTDDEDRDDSVGHVLGLARQLLGTDAAFVMELSEARACGSILLSAGVWTTEFQEIEPKEAGLFFEILRVESPLQVANYLRDQSFTHQRELDLCVKREGFRAFLGIPIFAEGEPSRVIFVADRHERIYHTADIFILEQLAIQCSVVLRQFRQRTESSQTLAMAEESLSNVSSELQAVRKRDHLLSQVLDLAQSPNCSSKLERLLSQEIGGEVEVLSLQQLVGAQAHNHLSASLRELIVRSVQTAKGAGEWKRLRMGEQNCHIWPLFLESRPWGALVSGDPDAENYSELFGQVARVLSVCSLGGAEDRVRLFLESSNAFFSLFHYGFGQLTAMQKARLQDLDIYPDGSNRLAILQGDVERIADYLEKNFQDFATKVLIGVGQEQIGLLGKNNRVEEILEAIRGAKSLKFEQLELSVFISDPFDSLEQAKPVFQQCQEYVRIISSLRLKAGQGWFTASSLPKSLQLLSGLSEDQRKNLVEGSIGTVLDYDRRHKTELFATAQALVQNQFSISAASAELFVHANTVRHRMLKLDELLGKGWNAGLRLLDFQLAASIVVAQQLDFARR